MTLPDAALWVRRALELTPSEVGFSGPVHVALLPRTRITSFVCSEQYEPLL